VKRSRAVVALVAPSLVALAVACSSFSGDRANDARPDAEAPGDAPVAPNPDDGALADAAGGDAAVGGDGAAAGCSWFCEDFDHAWPNSWAPFSYQGGTSDLATDDPVSPPNSLRADLPGDASAPTPGATWSRTQFGVFTSVHCTLKLKLESRSSGDLAELVAIDIATETGGKYRAVLSDNGYKAWTELDEPGSQDPFTQLPLDQWLAIGIDLQLGTPTRLTINGGLVSHALVSPAGDAGAARFTSVALAIGASRTSGPSGGEWRVDYDDVACGLAP
jgi:hypothetical protein